MNKVRTVTTMWDDKLKYKLKDITNIYSDSAWNCIVIKGKTYYLPKSGYTRIKSNFKPTTYFYIDNNQEVVEFNSYGEISPGVHIDLTRSGMDLNKAVPVTTLLKVYNKDPGVYVGKVLWSSAKHAIADYNAGVKLIMTTIRKSITKARVRLRALDKQKQTALSKDNSVKPSNGVLKKNRQIFNLSDVVAIYPVAANADMTRYTPIGKDSEHNYILLDSGKYLKYDNVEFSEILKKIGTRSGYNAQGVTPYYILNKEGHCISSHQTRKLFPNKLTSIEHQTKRLLKDIEGHKIDLQEWTKEIITS